MAPTDRLHPESSTETHVDPGLQLVNEPEKAHNTAWNRSRLRMTVSRVRREDLGKSRHQLPPIYLGESALSLRCLHPGIQSNSTALGALHSKTQFSGAGELLSGMAKTKKSRKDGSKSAYYNYSMLKPPDVKNSNFNPSANRRQRQRTADDVVTGAEGSQYISSFHATE